MSATDTIPAGRKTARTSVASPSALLAEPVVIREWKRNRQGESIKVVLRSFEDTTLIDIRTWFGAGGYRRPGKGFSASVRHLPTLAAAIDAALARARELGLIEGEGAT